MHRITKLFLVLFALLVPVFASAQETEFEVIQGTTLWDLATRIHQDPLQWESMFRTNVEAGLLEESDLRYNASNRPIVILDVGQRLLLSANADEAAPEIVEEVPATVTAPPIFVTEPIQNSTDFQWAWLIALLAIVAAVALALTMIQMKLANPATSGPPMRPGGITDESAAGHFQQMASSRTGPIGGTQHVPPERIRVVSVRRGRGFGLMRVRYRDDREETKRLNGETVYQALVEYPDGRQESMYCLQICANDLTYIGTRYFADRLFRFEPENVPIPVPTQETVARTENAEIRIGSNELSISENGRSVAFAVNNWTLQPGPDGGFIVTEQGRAGVEFRDGRVQGSSLPESMEPTEPAAPKAATTRKRSPRTPEPV